jgi:hypothetical protein
MTADRDWSSDHISFSSVGQAETRAMSLALPGPERLECKGPFDSFLAHLAHGDSPDHIFGAIVRLGPLILLFAHPVG